MFLGSVERATRKEKKNRAVGKRRGELTAEARYLKCWWQQGEALAFLGEGGGNNSFPQEGRITYKGDRN